MIGRRRKIKVVEETSPDAADADAASLDSLTRAGDATCFLCLYAWQDAPGGAQLARLLHEGVGTISIDALCQQLAELYTREIRGVGAAMGLDYYPEMSAEDFKRHITCHDLNPVTQTCISLGHCSTILDLLQQRMCVKKKGGEGVRVNDSVCRMWVRVSAHQLALQKALPEHCELMKRCGAGNGTLLK